MNIEDILNKLLSNQSISQEEQIVFERWMEKVCNRRTFYQLKQFSSAVYANKLVGKIDKDKAWQQVSGQLKPSRKLFQMSYYASAAIVVLCLGILFLLSRNELILPQDLMIVTNEQIIIDQKQVILTLSTGQQVALSNNLKPIVEESGAIIQSVGNKLEYKQTTRVDSLVFNTIKVPRGGEYMLKLSDGSTIWLNSESEITYPIVFGFKNRQITLIGEAFFDISKDSLRPFIVNTEEFNILVSGTKFNVRAYHKDIPSATLIEGGIQLEKDKTITLINPGHQATLTNGDIKIKKVDVEEIIAWQRGEFSFKQRPLEGLLNEIARWYDITIFYQDDEVRNYHFTAWFSRSTPIDELIHILEKTKKIKLLLKGNMLTVKINRNN